MKMIPISSKQIPFIEYDDEALQIHIQYHTGQTFTCSGVNEDQVRLILQSSNPYDMIVKMTASKTGIPPEA